MRSVVLLITIFIFLSAMPNSYSQGMSELDLDRFEKRETTGGHGAVKSPFTPSRALPDELMPEDIFLTGTILGAQKGYALINGNIIVTEGDTIAGFRVKSIYKDRVILQLLDKIHTLYLEGGF